MDHPAESRHAPRLTTHECEELNEWSARVGFELAYQQQGKGPFDAWFEMSVSDELRVVDQFCNRETTVSGVCPAGFIPIYITHNPGNKGIFQGKALSESEVAIMRPGFEGTYRTPAGLRMFSILVPEERLRSAVATMTGRSFDDALPGTRLVSLPHGHVSRLAWLARQVLDSPRDASGAAVAGPWLKGIDDHFITALTTGLSQPGATKSGVPAREKRVRYVAAARDYIESHLDAPLGLETLAHEVGVSPRTLEYAFREVFDLTPIQYIKTRRLHAARNRFLNSKDPELTVTRTALDFGFAHLSYFARDYHALFGEYPSETLGDPARRR